MTDGYQNPTWRVDAVVDLLEVHHVSHLVFQATWDSREMYGYGATLRFATSIDAFDWKLAATVTVSRDERVVIDISQTGGVRYIQLEWVDAVGSTLEECWNGWGDIRELQVFGCPIP
jgi:hypothetical protein